MQDTLTSLVLQRSLLLDCLLGERAQGILHGFGQNLFHEPAALISWENLDFFANDLVRYARSRKLAGACIGLYSGASGNGFDARTA